MTVVATCTNARWRPLIEWGRQPEIGPGLGIAAHERNGRPKPGFRNGLRLLVTQPHRITHMGISERHAGSSQKGNGNKDADYFAFHGVTSPHSDVGLDG